jgi:hypothetical protein
MSRITPEFWIDDVVSKDYEPYLMGDDELDPISSIKNHAITSPSQNLTDVITRRYHKKKGGRIYEAEKVIRAAQELSVTYTIVTGPFVESKILRRARDSAAGCTTTVFLIYQCPEEDRQNHAYIFADGIMNPPVRVNDPFPIDETTMAEWQFEFRIETEILLKEEVAFLGATEANDDPLYAVAIMTQDCVTCEDTPYQTLLATGGDGTADMVIVKSTDRLNTLTAKTATAPTGSVGTCIWTEGDVALIGFADLAKTELGEVTDPETGGTQFSVDGGDTWTLDADITVSIFAVGKFGGQYFAAGGAGAGQAVFYVSDNGIDWTSVTDDDLPADEAISDVAVDEENEEIFVTCEAGTMLKGFYQGDNIVFSPLTLPGSPTKVFKADVARPGRIAVGGSGGYFAESLDQGVTWTQKSLSGTNDILGIAAKKWRTIIGNATAIQERSILPYSNNNFTSLTIQNGQSISGNVTAVCKTTDDDSELHYFAVVTDVGECVFCRDDSHYS